jgi:hypothetical protein
MANNDATDHYATNAEELFAKVTSAEDVATNPPLTKMICLRPSASTRRAWGS